MVFKLNQETLAKEEACFVKIHRIENLMSASVEDSQLASVVPFEQKGMNDILGTTSHGLIMHLISAEERISVGKMKLESSWF